MFNFTHTEQELRDIIQAMEGKLLSMQQHLQKLVAEANAQAQAKLAPKEAEESHGGTE